MTYNRPNVALLGNAASITGHLFKVNEDFSDIYTQMTGLRGIIVAPPPAYDLDE